MHVGMEADTINSCLFIVGVRNEIWEQVAFELFIQPDNFQIGLTGRKHRWIKQNRPPSARVNLNLFQKVILDSGIDDPHFHLHVLSFPFARLTQKRTH